MCVCVCVCVCVRLIMYVRWIEVCACMLVRLRFACLCVCVSHTRELHWWEERSCSICLVLVCVGLCVCMCVYTIPSRTSSVSYELCLYTPALLRHPSCALVADQQYHHRPQTASHTHTCTQTHACTHTYPHNATDTDIDRKTANTSANTQDTQHIDTAAAARHVHLRTRKHEHNQHRQQKQIIARKHSTTRINTCQYTYASVKVHILRSFHHQLLPAGQTIFVKIQTNWFANWLSPPSSEVPCPSGQQLPQYDTKYCLSYLTSAVSLPPSPPTASCSSAVKARATKA